MRTGRPLVASCVQLAVDGGLVVATSQLYGGKLRAEVEVSGPAIVSVVSGLGSGSAAAAAAEATEADGEAADGEAADARGVPEPEDVRSPDLSAVHTRFVARREPEPGDVDITREEILVSVGRGIGGAENVELAQELADALGGALSGSRPVIDAGWLAKSRQVGKSGARVRPKLYLACGISGAPEHLEGIAGAELVIAINTDPNAPIFEVADYGATEDLFDVLPALVEALDAAAL